MINLHDIIQMHKFQPTVTSVSSQYDIVSCCRYNVFSEKIRYIDLLDPHCIFFLLPRHFLSKHITSYKLFQHTDIFYFSTYTPIARRNNNLRTLQDTVFIYTSCNLYELILFISQLESTEMSFQISSKHYKWHTSTRLFNNECA